MAKVSDYFPSKLGDLLGWAQNFDTILASIFASVGISSAQSALLHTKVQAFSAAMALTDNNVTRSPGNITDRDNKKDDMIAYVRTLVNIIQAFPGTTDLMRENLRITVRKIPAPKGAPGTPYGFKLKLTNIGSLDISWKNRDATACVYNIYRKLDAVGEFESLGGVGGKKYTDTTVPAGTAQVEYQVQAVRSTGVSDWGIYTVKFGSGSTGITAVEGTPLKAAA